MAIKTSKICFDVDTEKAEHQTRPQFGMRYPDGTITWDFDEARDSAVPSIYFKDLAANKSAALHSWRLLLERRAQVTRQDPETYIDQHRLVARDVNIFTTEPRDVVR